MTTLERSIMIFVGAFLFLTGLGKAYWEIKSWEVLSTLEQRPPLVGNDPRVYFRSFIVVAAIGLTLLILGCLF